jgi:hypothetical protein
VHPSGRHLPVEAERLPVVEPEGVRPEVRMARLEVRRARLEVGVPWLEVGVAWRKVRVPCNKVRGPVHEMRRPLHEVRGALNEMCPRRHAAMPKAGMHSDSTVSNDDGHAGMRVVQAMASCEYDPAMHPTPVMRRGD